MRPSLSLLLLILLVLLLAPAASAQDTPDDPAPAPTAERLEVELNEEGEEDEDAPLSPAEVARLERAAGKAFENFQGLLMGDDLEGAWDYLSSAEQEYLYGNQFERFRLAVEELREDEETWVLYSTMAVVRVELDVDDPVYAYATVHYEDEEGEEDEDEVDLVLEGGRWKVEGYF